ncbi:MAG: hypothetical protein GKS07_02580 [Nitrosopumilus sp.]|nr:MAG: hypothetical protein GKS07_02580 [Nitrosopumilus sp.]
MTDMLLDDVKALLDKDFGDDRILKQICRACEHNEVISNYERNYVRELAEKYLGKKPESVPIPVVESKPVVSDYVPTEIQPIQQSQTLQAATPKVSYSKSKNTKIMLGMSGIVLVIILAIAVSFSGGADNPAKIDAQTTPQIIVLSIQTDLTSYAQKDLISISGFSDTVGSVNLSIESPSGELVWAEQVNLKSNGQFSTLTIAGGPGWERSGTYNMAVDNGTEIKSGKFSFTT